MSDQEENTDQPGASQADDSQPGAGQSDVSQPGTDQPGAGQPSPSQPNIDPNANPNAVGHEVIDFAGFKIAIQREPTQETYLALRPPDAEPYVVAPREAEVGFIAGFIQPRLETLRELQIDMQKHFKKTKSLKCRFKTGDVAHLLGRPFMLRVNPLSGQQRSKKGTRTRTSLRATMHSEVSLIDLFVAQVGNYDQGRIAFLGFAQPIFARNVGSLLQQSMERVFPEAPLPLNVGARPIRDSWVRFDPDHDAVWFSDRLIPYPAHAVVYAYLNEAIKHLLPDASDEQRAELLTKGVANWQEMRTLLADPNNRYAL